eukprot:211240-Chlamydomonas_euryale.AAC.2
MGGCALDGWMCVGRVDVRWKCGCAVEGMWASAVDGICGGGRKCGGWDVRWRKGGRWYSLAR